MAVRAGYKGKVEINGTKIGGSVSWGMSGDVRAMLPADEFEHEIITHLPGQIEGGEITLAGHCRAHDDTGQQLLKTLFDAGTAITNVKLYTSKADNEYFEPDSGTTPASYVTVTNYNAIGTDKAGLATFTATLKVSGVMKPVNTGVAVEIEAVGIHALIATSVNFIGRLINMGGQTPISCYFEYGTTVAYGTDTSTPDSLTAVGLFEDVSGLLVTATQYHWRVHATHTGGTVHIVGKDQTFTTP